MKLEPTQARVGSSWRDNSWTLNTVPGPDYGRLQGMCVTVVGGNFLRKEVDKGGGMEKAIYLESIVLVICQ